MSIEAMKLALEAMGWTDEWRPENLAENAIKALYQAIEAAEQAQPVAWMYEQAKYGPTDLRGQQWHPVLSQHEPYTESGMARGLTPLYTTPPQRKPLTDEEIAIIWRDIDGSDGMLIRFARAIEAAHNIIGEKE